MSSTLLALLLALGTVAATVGGGALALRATDRMHLVLGLSGGVLLGLVFFDLIPEVLELTSATVGGVPAGMVALAVGFLALHVLERGLGIHHAHGDHYDEHEHGAPLVGLAAGAILVGHALIDGLSIGVAFSIDDRLGVAVGIAVVAHRFADGLNTVAVMRLRGNTRAQTVGMLVLNALAPLAGVAIAEVFEFGEHGLALLLGFFAGFLLYLATSDVLPEAHSRHPARWTLLTTIVGMTLMGLVVSYG